MSVSQSQPDPKHVFSFRNRHYSQIGKPFEWTPCNSCSRRHHRLTTIKKLIVRQWHTNVSMLIPGRLLATENINLRHIHEFLYRMATEESEIIKAPQLHCGWGRDIRIKRLGREWSEKPPIRSSIGNICQFMTSSTSGIINRRVRIPLTGHVSYSGFSWHG